MEHTTNYNLKKPGYEDDADIQDINDNMDILDKAVKSAASQNLSDMLKLI